MASTTARRPQRATPKAAPKRAELKVVRSDERARTVGAISTIAAAFFFIVLFALAGLHAVVVQTQADLDGVNADITALEELRVVRHADLARADSAVGIEEAALAAGLVPTAAPLILTPVSPGQLAPPASADPFTPGSPSTSTALVGNPE